MQSEMFQRSFCHVFSSQYAPIFCHFKMALAGSCNNLLKNSSEGEDYRFAFFPLCCGARVQNEMILSWSRSEHYDVGNSFGKPLS